MRPEFVVVDTNIIFSAFIPKSVKIRDALLDNRLRCCSPDFLITEINKHQKKLLKASGLRTNEFWFLYSEIISQVTLVPLEIISKESRQKAYDLCKGIDEKDTPFIALAIEFDIPLWTGDKKLKEALNKSGFNMFYRL